MGPRFSLLFLIIALGVGISVSVTRAQQSEANLAYRTPDPKLWAFQFEENALMDYDTPLRQSSTVVVMRFCSTASLKAGVGRYRRPIDSVWNFLKQAYGYSPNHFLISTQPDCIERKGMDAIELWVVPEEAKKPAATKTITMRQLFDQIHKE